MIEHTRNFSYDSKFGVPDKRIQSDTVPGLLVDELTAEQADAVIRESWPARRNVWPACCGNCQQGERICPTPDACQVRDNNREAEAMGALLLYAAACVAAIVFLVGVST